MKLNEKYTKLLTKIHKLKYVLKDINQLAIAFSGGSDSYILAFMAKDILGKHNIRIMTVLTEFISPNKMKIIRKRAISLGIHHSIFGIDMLKYENITKNDKKRCYYCKKYILEKLKRELFPNEVLSDGTNLTDIKSKNRPGIKALKELGIRSILAEAGFSRKYIKQAYEYYQINDLYLPHDSCTATRIPENTKISLEKLKFIQKIEDFLSKRLSLSYIKLIWENDNNYTAYILKNKKEDVFKIKTEIENEFNITLKIKIKRCTI